MNSYEENEMRKVGAPSIKRKVLRCPAGKATLVRRVE